MVGTILLILSFPPYNQWPLIWVGFVPMMIAQFRVLPRRASSLASAVTIGGWLGGYLTPIFAGSGLYIALASATYHRHQRSSRQRRARFS